MNKDLGRRLTVLSVGFLLLGLLATSVSAASRPADPEGTQGDPRTLKFYDEALTGESLDGVGAYWVPYYMQTDPAWADDYMETKHPKNPHGRVLSHFGSDDLRLLRFLSR